MYKKKNFYDARPVEARDRRGWNTSSNSVFSTFDPFRSIWRATRRAEVANSKIVRARSVRCGCAVATTDGKLIINKTVRFRDANLTRYILSYRHVRRACHCARIARYDEIRRVPIATTRARCIVVRPGPRINNTDDNNYHYCSNKMFRLTFYAAPSSYYHRGTRTPIRTFIDENYSAFRSLKYYFGKK